jgi:hypothetical protein
MARNGNDLGRGKKSPARTPHPGGGSRSAANVSLFLLVGVVFIVALLMLVSLIEFAIAPDPAVKTVPMLVTLVLMTGASSFMLALALNASFLPFIPRRRLADLQLMTLAMALTGVVTGLLSLGGAVGPYVARLVLSGVAFVFIMLQDARLRRAREAAAAGRAPAPSRPLPRTPRPSWG